MTRQQRATAAIAALIRQGADPHRVRHGLAETYDLPLTEIEALITAAPAPHSLSPEGAAQERLAIERASRRRDPIAYRAWAHEED